MKNGEWNSEESRGNQAETKRDNHWRPRRFPVEGDWSQALTLNPYFEAADFHLLDGGSASAWFAVCVLDEYAFHLMCVEIVGIHDTVLEMYVFIRLAL